MSSEQAQRLRERLSREAENGGYHLNPDMDFTLGLMEGLLVNEERYGYRACPCRLASGDRREDLDIICPCDYRDPDLSDFGTCYCALYVSPEVLGGARKLGRIRDRRPVEAADRQTNSGRVTRAVAPGGGKPELKYPVWRCRVCGYLCAREDPPETCPVCKATKDRFERFL